MKALIVVKCYSPVIGGVETVARQTAIALKANGHNVTVLCASKTFSLTTKTEYIDGIKVVRCSSLGSLLSLPITFSIFYRLYALLRENDLVIFHEPFPLSAILCSLYNLQRSKGVIFWHSEIVRQRAWFAIFYSFYSRMINKVEAIIHTYPEQLENSIFKKQFALKKNFLIPLGVSDLNDTSAKKPAFISSNKERFCLYLGRLCYYKGLETLVKSMPFIDDEITIYIVGEGEISDSNRLILKAAKNIRLHEKFVTEDEKVWMLENADFFLFPSVQESEAFGITQVESLRSGTPIINTNLNTGVPWVSINSETGITVQAGDSKQLADAINSLWHDEELRKKFSKNAKLRYQKYFTEQNMFDNFNNSIDSLFYD